MSSKPTPFAASSEIVHIDQAKDRDIPLPPIPSAPEQNQGNEPPLQPPAEPPSSPTKEKYTLEEAFDYFYESDNGDIGEVNIERAIRSVGFLLNFVSEHGNQDVPGFAAHGLAQILNTIARECLGARRA